MLTRKQVDDIERVAIDARERTRLIDDGKFALIATVRELREVLEDVKSPLIAYHNTPFVDKLAMGCRCPYCEAVRRIEKAQE